MAAEIRITINSSSAGSGISEAKKDIASLGETAEQSGKGFGVLKEVATGFLREIGAAAFNVAVGGLKAFGDAISDGISDAREAAKLNAQTAAVIKSTGGAAGVSAEQVADYASSLSAAAGQSLFGDDQIQQSENLLLTFSNIKSVVLESATAISVDMAQALGGAPKDSAIQLGKALNDPIKGITALTRVGVTFTDEQKNQIKTLQESGHMQAAQTIILEELNKEFGGSAAAAAAADGGWAQFNDRMGEAKEAIGTAVLPLLGSLAGLLNDTVAPIIENVAGVFGDLMSDLSSGGIGVFADDIREMTGIDIMPLVNGIQTVVTWLQEMLPIAIQTAADLWSGTLQPALATVIGFIQTTVIPILSGVLADALTFINEHWEAFKGALIAIAAVLAGAALVGAVAAIAATIATLANPITLIVAAVALLGAAWTEDWGGIRTTLSQFWETTGRPIFEQVAAWLSTNIPTAIQTVSGFWNETLLPALNAVWSFLNAYIIPIIVALVQTYFTILTAEIQLVADFWNNVLHPALNTVWSFIATSVIPILTELANNTFATVSSTTQGIATLWTGTLQPALNAVWSFLNTYVIPLFTSLANVTFALVKLELRVLAGLWTNILQPALNSVWSFITTNLTPAIAWLNDNVLIPLGETLKSIAFFILGTLKPYLADLGTVINGNISSAFDHLSGVAGGVRDALGNIGKAVQDVIKWLSDLASTISNIDIPDWLEGHSPPPLANWLSSIAEAANMATDAMKPQLGLSAPLAVQAADYMANIGNDAQSNRTTHHNNQKTITYSPTYHNTGNPASTESAILQSLASV